MPDPRPKKKLPLDLESLARGYTDLAIRQIGTILANDIDSGRRLQAADILLDRGWGRPSQQQTTTVKGAIEVMIRDIAAEKAKKKI